MATREDKESAALSGETTPIAHLRPDIGDQPKRLVAGEVTITWPYSSVKKSIAFLLAEPDVRQRRVKGLVRVQLSGPSAKAVADCGIGGGDAITLSLDGVEWAQDDTPARPPGSRLEWQLKYSHKLVAEVKSGETGETKILKVDQPTDELTVPEPPAIDVPAIPETESQHEPGPDRTPATRATPRRAFDEVEPNEYESPAFIKRARTSYGALLDEDFDIFEDDGGRKGKGRKRPKYGRHSGMWRYTSASASPEPEVHEEPQETEQPTVIPAASSPGPRPEMMDEGCQTVELDLIPIPETQPIAASHSFAMPEAASPNKAREREYYSAPLANMGGIEAYSANQPSGVGIQTSPPQTAIPGPDLTATNPSLFSPFLPDGAGYGAPRFEAAVPGSASPTILNRCTSKRQKQWPLWMTRALAKNMMITQSPF
ncbi:hypothetical protein NKR23_g5155 [Pleurostoma richardsiae]|uniref:Uncharacterized protein n=1 Tax=Pleurostoma richardsiae TaxID=41990 RepID=A0AA38VR97_9PEZI|nr:hypothetical protein NKR23_g5155 [Pleurostoma richardsiae]